MVATALGAGSIDAYTTRAQDVLSSGAGVLLLLGAETAGLPESLLRHCVKLRIPSLSSSINVGNAFSIVLTVMLLAMAQQQQ